MTPALLALGFVPPPSHDARSAGALVHQTSVSNAPIATLDEG